MMIMRLLRKNEFNFFKISARGENIHMQERVVAHLHKWIYVEEMLNECPGEEQVSVIMSRAHDFAKSFFEAKEKAQKMETENDLRNMRKKLNKKI